jgi:hypothetical protein
MATYAQLPGSMNLAFRRGNDFATVIDFDGTTLVGYAVTASVVSQVTGATVVPMTTTVADAAAGQVGVSLTDTQTAAMPAGTYGWRLDWTAPGDVKRTALQGTVEVTA